MDHLQLQTPFNYVLILLVFMDFLMTSVGIPLDVVAAAKYGWWLGEELCVFLGFVMTVSGKLVNLKGLKLISDFDDESTIRKQV